MARSSHAVTAAPAPTASSLRRFVAGVTMLLLATALTANGLVAGTASAQEFEDDLGGGAPGGAAGTTEELEIRELALYASSLADTVPDTLRSGIPPAVVCVVANELGVCPESTAPLRNTLSEGFNSLLDGTPSEPFHPVPPDTIAVSVLAGADRYQTAVLFDPPAVPEGEEYVSFEVRFPVTQPTFDVNSPAFRRVILGLFQSIAENNDPAFFFEGLEEAATDEELIDLNDDILGIEVCPFTEPFEPGGPPAAQSDDDLPRDDEFGEVAVDCLLGASGQIDEETEEFVFDLAFAANAWASGELENFGLLMRPTGVENLAFGDEDFSTSAQISLDTEDVTVTFASAEPPPPPGEFADFDDGFDDGFDEGFEDDFGGDGFGDDGFAEAPFADEGGFEEMDGFEPGSAIGGPSDADGPSVADPTEAPQAADGAGEGQQQVMARPARGEPINPWWLWLLVPLFGGGGYLVAAPLLAPTAAAGAATPGAMSRLLARSGGGLAPS